MVLSETPYYQSFGHTLALLLYKNGGSSRIRTYAAFLGADLSLAGTYDTRLCHGSKNGRDSRIRTDDILLPKQALYQAELHPVEIGAVWGNRTPSF
jgi:hypothetical protein